MAISTTTRPPYPAWPTATALKVHRIACGLTQDELAGLVGLSRRTIGAIEAGGSPQLRTAQALADALSCQVEELFPANDEG